MLCSKLTGCTLTPEFFQCLGKFLNSILAKKRKNCTGKKCDIFPPQGYLCTQTQISKRRARGVAGVCLVREGSWV